MAKHKQLPARAVADTLGFPPLPKPMPGQPEPRIGRKALVGQYVRPYKRTVDLSAPGRISKGRQRRHAREDGTEGRLDYSAFINAHR